MQLIKPYLLWATNPVWWALILSAIAVILALVAWVRTRRPRVAFQTEPADGPTDQGYYLLRNIGRCTLTNVQFMIDPSLIEPDPSGEPSLLRAALRRPRFRDNTLGDPPSLMPKQSGRFMVNVPPGSVSRARRRVLITCDQDKAVHSVELAPVGRVSQQSVRCAKNVLALYAPWTKSMGRGIDVLRPTLEQLIDAISDFGEHQIADEDLAVA